MTSPNVYQRINAAARMLAEVPWVKDAETSAYKSVPIDQIRREVAKAETEAGLTVIYDELDSGTIPFGPKNLCMVKARITYYNIDDPEDCVSFVRTAIAQDAGDKGWNKAESMVYKNLYKGLYYIGERDEDPDTISNAESDLLSVYRDERFRQAFDNLVREHIDEVRKAQQAAREAETLKRRKAMYEAAQGDRLFGGSSKREEPKPEPQRDEELEALLGGRIWKDGAEVMAQREAKMRAIDLAEAKRELMRVYRESPESIDRYIQMEEGRQPPAWSEEHIRACYYDLMEGQR